MRRKRVAWAAIVAITAAGVATADTASDDRAGEHYVLHCSGCHGRDGRGIPGVTPSLHGLGALAADERGRDYLVRVPGVAQAPLSDADLAALLDWLVTHFSEGVSAPSFRVDEIALLRARPLRDPIAARAELAVDPARRPGDGPR